MKKMEEIRLMIDIAQRGWTELKGEMQKFGVCDSARLSEKKEKLKNLLEDIRENLEMNLATCNDSIFKRIIRNLLDKILDISEGLGRSYMLPGYLESYYIADTIEMAER